MKPLPTNQAQRRWTSAALWTLVALAGGCSLMTHPETGAVIPAVLPPEMDPIVQTEMQALAEKGLREFRNGNLDEAAKMLETVVRIDPSNGPAHNNLGLVRYQQRQLSAAAQHFEAASQLRPEDPLPLNNLGMALESGGRLEEAAEFYRRAVDLNSRRPMYLGNLVRVKYRQGDRDELIRMQMEQLLFMETRPSWRAWLEERLALELNPYLDRGENLDTSFDHISIPTSSAIDSR